MTEGTRATASKRPTRIDDLPARGTELSEQQLRLAAGAQDKSGFVLTIGTYVGPAPIDVSLDW